MTRTTSYVALLAGAAGAFTALAGAPLAAADTTPAIPAPIPAQAQWQAVPNSQLDSTSEAAVLGLPGEVTLLAYRSPGSAPNTQRLLTATIGANGALTAGPPITGPAAGSNNPPDTIGEDWSALANPALIGDPNVLQAFWGGIFDGSERAPSLETARTPNQPSLGSWTYQTGGVDVSHCDSSTGADCSNAPTDEAHSYASDVSAIELPDGTPLEAWASSDGVFVHRGIAPDAARIDQTQPEAPASSADYQAQLGGNFGYEPTLSHYADGTNPTIAWYSNATSNTGVFVQHVDPATGNPLGTPMLIPGSASLSGLRGRTPLTGRLGSTSFYTALPGGSTGEDVVLTEIAADGTMHQTTISSGPGDLKGTAITSDSLGRLWVAWARQDANGDVQVYATRSNPAATAFDPPIVVALPSGADNVDALDGVAQHGPLDLVATLDQGAGSASIGAVQIFPNAAVAAAPVTAQPNVPAPASVTVSDAGVPVSGATVSFVGSGASVDAGAGRRSGAHHGHSKLRLHGVTNGHGVAKLVLPAHHRSWTAKLKVTRPGYAPRTVSLSVRIKH